MAETTQQRKQSEYQTSTMPVSREGSELASPVSTTPHRRGGEGLRPGPQATTAGEEKGEGLRTEGRRHQGHRPGPQATTRGPIAAAAPSQARGTVGPGPRCPRRSNPRPAALVDGRRADQWPALARGGGGKSEIRGPPPPRSRVPSGSPIRIPAASGGACAVRLPGVVPRPTSRRRLAAMPGTIPGGDSGTGAETLGCRLIVTERQEKGCKC